MIARLRGRAVAYDAEGLVIEVGGVGYRVLATQSAVRKAENMDEVVIETHLHVREDAMQLYGFATADERSLFESLLAVTGVGPKVALGIVSAYSPGELRRAIVTEDAALFQTIPGIGRKLALRVVLELKEKVGMLEVLSDTSNGSPTRPGDGHLIARDALVELGYSIPEAEQRLAAIDPDLPPSERVREALKAA